MNRATPVTPLEPVITNSGEVLATMPVGSAGSPAAPATSTVSETFAPVLPL